MKFAIAIDQSAGFKKSQVECGEIEQLTCLRIGIQVDLKASIEEEVVDSIRPHAAADAIAGDRIELSRSTIERVLYELVRPIGLVVDRRAKDPLPRGGPGRTGAFLPRMAAAWSAEPCRYRWLKRSRLIFASAWYKSAHVWWPCL